MAPHSSVLTSLLLPQSTCPPPTPPRFQVPWLAAGVEPIVPAAVPRGVLSFHIPSRGPVLTAVLLKWWPPSGSMTRLPKAADI